MSRKRVGFLVSGASVFLYAMYGYSSGSIYKVPGRYGRLEPMVPDDRVIYCVLSYVAFSLIFFIWAFLPEKKRRRGSKTTRQVLEGSMWALFLAGLTLQAIS